MARLNITVDDDQYDAIEETIKERKITFSRFVRDALRVYLHILKEVVAGKSIYVGTNGILEKEILLP